MRIRNWVTTRPVHKTDKTNSEVAHAKIRQLYSFSRFRDMIGAAKI